MQPLGYKPSALAVELNNSNAIAGKELGVYPVGVLHYCIFIIPQLWLASHPRNTAVLLDTGNLVLVEKGPVKLIKRVKIAHSFLQSVSDQFHVIILSLPM